jgi:hypothetical protein
LSRGDSLAAVITSYSGACENNSAIRAKGIDMLEQNKFRYHRGAGRAVGAPCLKGKFGRMFPFLRPLVPPENYLIELGRVMRDDSSGFDDSGGNNVAAPAGYTYLGQFITHDITFDPTALQGALTDPSSLMNFRTPCLDLDSVYGSGPAADPYLYQRRDRDLFLIGRTSEKRGPVNESIPPSLPFDLLRAANGYAIIGDPRNDENIIIAQLHLLFLRFHNKVVEDLRNGTIPRKSLSRPIFEEARELVTWHYQWIVLNEFLPLFLDHHQLAEALGRRCFYNPVDGLFIPVEFSAAANRFGHSMVRNAYDYNRVFRFPKNGVQPPGTVLARLNLLFRFTGASGPGDTVPIPSEWIIDWRRFFPLDRNVQVISSRLINPFISNFFHEIPPPPPPPFNSIVIRNLLRGRSFGLPSGQSVALHMGFHPLSESDIASGPDGEVAARRGFHIESPLWYYVLKEAEIQGKGERLGQVGSRIVAEVLIGLLENDINSYVVRNPNWTPILPSKVPGDFTMVDLINYVGNPNPIGGAP